MLLSYVDEWVDYLLTETKFKSFRSVGYWSGLLLALTLIGVCSFYVLSQKPNRKSYRAISITATHSPSDEIHAAVTEFSEAMSFSKSDTDIQEKQA